MTVQRQLLFWAIAFVVFCIILWAFRGILTPFFAGAVLAYFLDPLADRLEKLKFSRFWSAATIVGLVYIALTFVFILIIPPLIAQMGDFIERLPTLIGALETFLSTNLNDWVANVLPGTEGSLPGSVSDIVRQGAQWASGLLGSLVTGGQAIIGLLGFLVITPVVTFYMLWDWDNTVARVDTWLPRDHVTTIRRLAKEIDGVLAGFVRGQITVALMLGSFYALSLSLLGLSFGLMIGIIAGIMNIVPYIGSVLGFVIAVGVALFQFWPDWIWIAAVAGVFVAGQIVEGNVLQPLLIGDKVGLHPVWLMFGLVAFSAMFGIAGTLIAVPAAAAIGVLVRFGLDQYLSSRFFRGVSGGAPAVKTSSTAEANE